MEKLDLYNNWVEYIALLLMITGFIIMQMNWIFSGSKVMTYLTILLGGMIVGRIFYKVDKDNRFRWFLISCGFLIGFMLGAHYGRPTTIVILYLIGAYASFYIHDKGYIKSVSY